ncbi:DUF3309 family protein [Aureimonas psammosilenae]|uniref:DUF3309 family protein n=1 Tax=Aureimonas psammosilenae TaxID=2495496 RepID=UPI001260CC6F|nr:hypothetical protein [Aureimonas psammosilenae]
MKELGTCDKRTSVDFTFAAFAFAVLLVLTVAAAPIWPWSRRLGGRPMIVSAVCLLVYVLSAVWTV